MRRKRNGARIGKSMGAEAKMGWRLKSRHALRPKLKA
jgi:hypothetical protein